MARRDGFGDKNNTHFSCNVIIMVAVENFFLLKTTAAANDVRQLSSAALSAANSMVTAQMRCTDEMSRG
jgi:hypothetical protein